MENNLANTSLESMSISSDDEAFQDESFRITSIEFTSVSHTFEDESPFSSSSEFSSPHSLTHKDYLTNRKSSEDIAFILAKLGIRVSSEEKSDKDHWFGRLCYYLSNLYHETPTEEFEKIVIRLKKHLTQRKSGRLSVDLVSASLLKIHPDIMEMTNKLPKVGVSLPSLIHCKLLFGKFVPIRHIIYGDALKQGYEKHYNEGHVVAPEPYPLHIIKENPPAEFINMIRKPDVLRGATSHSLILGLRFPMLAAKMHYVSRDLWNLMFVDDVSVQFAMDVYDEYFKSFEKQLCSLYVKPMIGLPPKFVDWVRAKYQNK